MNIQTKIKNISIDTLFRDNYENTISTDFSFNLPVPVEKVVSMRISAMEIPNVWRAFSEIEFTNTFKITIYNFKEAIKEIKNGVESFKIVDVANREFLITIPPGNYTSLNFENMINAYFVNNGKGLEYLYCNIDQITTKTTFRAYSYTDEGGTNIDPFDNINYVDYYSPNFYYTLDFSNDNNRPLYQKVGWMLGFKKSFYEVKGTSTYIASALPNQNNQLITYYAYQDSESSYGSSVYPYIYLDIDEYQSNTRSDSLYHFVGANRTNLLNNNIIARISVSSSQNTIIIDNGSDRIFKQRNYIGPITIERIRVRLLNRFGNVIDIIGNDYSFILEITYMEY
jgi:hypothetical protein